MSKKLYVIKSRMVFDDSLCTLEITRQQLESHENIIGYIVFTADPILYRGCETKARVISRVTQDDCSTKSKCFALLQANSDEGGTDTFVLINGYHSHGTQPHDFEVRVACERNR
jgi:hypothetical protein